jgi:hypothetical protein
MCSMHKMSSTRMVRMQNDQVVSERCACCVCKLCSSGTCIAYSVNNGCLLDAIRHPISATCMLQAHMGLHAQLLDAHNSQPLQVG